MLISVIIPTFNKIERLRLTLCSLQQQQYQNYEIIIVDDGSDSQTQDYLSQLQNTHLYERLRIIRQSNEGRSKARNIGAKNATGDRLVFIDDDVIVAPDFLNEHAKNNEVILHGKIVTLSYLKFFRDPTKAIFYQELTTGITKSINNLYNRSISQEDIYNSFYEKIATNNKISRSEWLIQNVFENNFELLYWLGVTGGNFSIDRKLFFEIGGFDESYGKVWGYEDFDLGYRLLRYGCHFDYNTFAIGYHIAHYRILEDIYNQNAMKFIANFPNDIYIKIVIKYLCGSISQKEINELIRNF